MKYLNAIIFISLIMTGCSSSVKFTDEETSGDKTVTRRKFEKNKEEDKPVTKHLPEIRDDENNEENGLPGGVAEEIPDEIILESATGVASYYGKKFHGRKTASGEKYDMNEFTAAHGTYPFNTIVKVTNLSNNRVVKVRINDRKPSLHGRIIDVSHAAASELDFLINGIAQVRIDVISWGNKK